MVGSTTSRPLSFREGIFRVGENEVKICEVLMDTGALYKSYISSELVQKHRDAWKDNIIPYRSVARLADQITKVETTEMVRGSLSFVSDNGEKEYTGVVEAIVWDMPGMDFIVGLPDIVRNYVELLTEMLNGAMYNIMEVSDMREGEVKLWSKGEVEESPEEENTPMPVAFGPVLSFMEGDYEDSRKEYFSLLDSHVGEHLSSFTEFMNLLKSDLAVDRFVPKEWTGIQGFPPLDIQVKDNFPAFHKVRSRPINPRLYENAKKEFDRLTKYMYRPSVSPWASPLVIAPKATKPFIRFCGDYRWLNEYVILPQAYIPRVQYEVEKAMGFHIFLDIDMTNSFHQFPLTEDSSKRLAIQTPWGLVEPAFLPEGVAPASGHLQYTMMKMFSDFHEWSIIIFDNVLLLANDQKDATTKLQTFLERCQQHNVFLKVPKSWFGFSSVKFFGYKVSYGKREMDEERKKAIMEFRMPTCQKEMQSFLGAALFFKSFVPNYSGIASELNKMTHKDFCWKQDTWTYDYVGDFERMKIALSLSVANHFPDYELDWVLRVDASDKAVGAVLFQERPDQYGVIVHEPIGFASQKFSSIAARWDAFKKEAYAAFYGVQHFSYYLRGKAFLLETDHRNLLWIEKSEVPIVVRWRVFLQSFVMFVRHISGTKNTVADWLSRMHAYLASERAISFMSEYHGEVSCILDCMFEFKYSTEEGLDAIMPVQQEQKVWTPEEMFAEVHGGRKLHFGARRTWVKLNQRFPGHRIPFRQVQQMVADCSLCQKDRLGMEGYVEPIYRHLKPDYLRKAVGVDTLKVTPVDDQGNSCLIVIVEFFTKYVWAMPASDFTAHTVAIALFTYFCTFGMFDELWSDPGSDLMSAVVAQLSE